ncbi:methyltransferase-like protein 22 isoform X2 [Rana temporaria]|uniref:methyltransferase-like protein 22 isoform X2 n=1 Tax=Rana temporaria TaxID=8407 RepID=UPI001AAD239E|nr:methyltransferase-like protein 22 isoform X2 [Rana temporaria]
MEVITFTKDTVLSDVHVHTQQKRHLMVRLNRVGQPVFQTHFKILWQNNNLKSASEDCVIITDNEDTENRCEEELLVFKAPTLCDIQTVESFLDEDGDLEVQRRPPSPDKDNAKDYARDVVCPTILTMGSEGEIEEEKCVNNKDVIKIEHTMATPLEDVGKQIWRGAFILADYILSQQDLFRGCTALELGAGTGFTSIIMATVAKTVYCTDVGDDLLEMCERNVSLNRSFMEQAGGQIKVKELDWLKNQLGTDPENLYNWTEDDISHFYDETTVIFAADVFYDDDLTDALFKTLYRITQSLRRNCIIYLSMERRYNFTLRYMNITCDAYNHFRNCLNNFETARHGKQRWSAQEIKLMFPQFFIYEREHLKHY